MLEFTRTFAPQIERWRQDIEQQQSGACARCHRNHRRLFLERDELGALQATCVECFVPPALEGAS